MPSHAAVYFGRQGSKHKVKSTLYDNEMFRFVDIDEIRSVVCMCTLSYVL